MYLLIDCSFHFWPVYPVDCDIHVMDNFRSLFLSWNYESVHFIGLPDFHSTFLQYFSTKMEALVMKTRGLLGHLVFKTQLRFLSIYLCFFNYLLFRLSVFRLGWAACHVKYVIRWAKLDIRHVKFQWYTSFSKTVMTDHNKPIYVLAGMDAISQIGSPPAIVGSR